MKEIAPCRAVVASLSVDELARRYRACRYPVGRSHWQIVWLVAHGHSGAAVARPTGSALIYLPMEASQHSWQQIATVGQIIRLITPTRRVIEL